MYTSVTDVYIYIYIYVGVYIYIHNIHKCSVHIYSHVRCLKAMSLKSKKTNDVECDCKTNTFVCNVMKRNLRNESLL